MFLISEPKIKGSTLTEINDNLSTITKFFSLLDSKRSNPSLLIYYLLHLYFLYVNINFMFLEIKNRIEAELINLIRDLDGLYHLNRISSFLYRSIHEFVARRGKRIRPTLLVIGYLGFKNKVCPGLYRTAISLELLHDFMLVHDDIIDKSVTRRGKPSLHKVLNRYIKGKENLKFTGEDLAIVAGDVMYAMAIHAFLSVKADMHCKERALRKLCEAAFYTGGGEFVEILYGLKSMDKMTKQDIYKIYDLKTANYTFAAPLCIGAILAGASKREVNILSKYGLYLGRAFQIKDDILGLFESEEKIGKSNLTDLQEAKKTILIWYAYQNSDKQIKAHIKKILMNLEVNKSDLYKIRRIIVDSGSLDFAKKEIALLTKKAEVINKSSAMQQKYKNSLNTYSEKLLKVTSSNPIERRLQICL